MTLNEIGEHSHGTTLAHGFHDPVIRCDGTQVNVRSVSAFERVALIVTECAEAMECLRVEDNPLAGATIPPAGVKPEGFLSELADVVIRTAELAAQYDLDLDGMIAAKLAFNDSRPARQGGKVL